MLPQTALANPHSVSAQADLAFCKHQLFSFIFVGVALHRVCRGGERDAAPSPSLSDDHTDQHSR